MSASSVAAPSYSAAAVPRAVNPWIVALAVVIPTFMEVLDTTIANVALRHIAGGLSAAVTDGEWVITSYLAANAIILPISGWLSVRLGRRNYFLLSILVFTVASALCGMATSLNMLILSRVLQGLAGGGLQPSSQGVLLDSFPKEKQGAAQTVFGIAALLAPVVGPTLGGYITDNYGWRWVFYINVPVGILALVMCNALVFDPDYLKAQSAEARKQNRAFDTLGLCLLAVTMTSWEVLLSKGQEWDWFNDPFLRVQTLALLFVLALGGLIVRETGNGAINSTVCAWEKISIRSIRRSTLISTNSSPAFFNKSGTQSPRNKWRYKVSRPCASNNRRLCPTSTPSSFLPWSPLRLSRSSSS